MDRDNSDGCECACTDGWTARNCSTPPTLPAGGSSDGDDGALVVIQPDWVPAAGGAYVQGSFTAMLAADAGILESPGPETLASLWRVLASLLPGTAAGRVVLRGIQAMSRRLGGPEARARGLLEGSSKGFKVSFAADGFADLASAQAAASAFLGSEGAASESLSNELGVPVTAGDFAAEALVVEEARSSNTEAPPSDEKTTTGAPSAADPSLVVVIIGSVVACFLILVTCFLAIRLRKQGTSGKDGAKETEQDFAGVTASEAPKQAPLQQSADVRLLDFRAEGPEPEPETAAESVTIEVPVEATLRGLVPAMGHSPRGSGSDALRKAPAMMVQEACLPFFDEDDAEDGFIAQPDRPIGSPTPMCDACCTRKPNNGKDLLEVRAPPGTPGSRSSSIFAGIQPRESLRSFPEDPGFEVLVSPGLRDTRSSTSSLPGFRENTAFALVQKLPSSPETPGGWATPGPVLGGADVTDHPNAEPGEMCGLGLEMCSPRKAPRPPPGPHPALQTRRSISEADPRLFGDLKRKPGVPSGPGKEVLPVTPGA